MAEQTAGAATTVAPDVSIEAPRTKRGVSGTLYRLFRRSGWL